MASITDDCLDSSMDDGFFSCKGCGEILEEGKAFELASNRWHIDCFRCNTCGTLLDGDADLLLLGDGSLICNNCTYSCNACGNKIEDLAILTGDQAFCASCFRCRNCKRKIDNLRYARTSQGIFCMDCHESLMARRRKKSKAAAQARIREKESSPLTVHKSLPALPPNATPVSAPSDGRVNPDSDTPTELSPRPRPSYPARTDSSNSLPSRSPERQLESATLRERSLALPQPYYRANRRSAIIQPIDSNGDADSYLVPVALDPNPPPLPLPPPSPVPPSLPMTALSPTPSMQFSASATIPTPEFSVTASIPIYANDYSSDPPRKPRDMNRDRPSNLSKPDETVPYSSNAPSLHIAFQDKGMQSSSDQEHSQRNDSTRRSSKPIRKDVRTLTPKTPTSVDEAPLKLTTKHPQNSQPYDFKLQDAPKSRKTVSPKPPLLDTVVAVTPSSRPAATGDSRDDEGTDDSGRSLLSGDGSSVGLSPESEDSVETTVQYLRHDKTITRKEVPNSLKNGNANARAGPNGANRAEDFMPHQPSSNSLARPSMGDPKKSDTYLLPRTPPLPPTVSPTKHNVSTPRVSPKLPRWSAGGDFTLDEDMARILGTDEGSSSILRRVSNAVRHGRHHSGETGQGQSRMGHARSISETTRGTTSPRWPKTPMMEDPISIGHSREISSPISLSATDDPAFLRRQLKNSEQRVAELERQFSTGKDFVDLHRRLVEKRKTITVLDAQSEIMIRQLEVLAGSAERAKDSPRRVDLQQLEDSAIKEFVQKLKKVKVSMKTSIEQLYQERDRLIEEKNQVIADRDRAVLEFDQLSGKNAQLADLNNGLTHQIQERFRAYATTADIRTANGLGICAQSSRGTGASTSTDAASIGTGTTVVGGDAEDQVVELGSTVVQVRRGQAKKFNWKKGSKAVAQNVAKGVNRAVVAFQQQGQDHRDRQHPGLTGDNIGLPYNMTAAPVDLSASLTSSGQPHGPMPNPGPSHAMNGSTVAGNCGSASVMAPLGTVSGGGGGGVGVGTGPGAGVVGRTPVEQQGRQAFTFFNRKNNSALAKSLSTNNLSTPTIAVDASVTLFGSDLTERAEFERRQIPCVVTRCIEEVELRGMDLEGIYRKTGGNSQIKMIQDGFDRSDDYDISDPAIDITAVTSVLKQYLRKLPTPLLTFDVYDGILESNAIPTETERCHHLRKVIATMPQVHRDCLEFLLFHLARVAQRESENLMPSKNLALVFAPTVMRDHNLEREMSDMHSKNLAMQFIIDNLHRVFAE